MCNAEFLTPSSHMFVSSDSVRHLIKATGGHCEYFMSLMLFSGPAAPVHCILEQMYQFIRLMFCFNALGMSVNKKIIAQNC